MTKARKSVPAPAPESDPLVLAVDRLTAELAIFRQVIDEIREDFSWVTRNGLPVQPIEHVHVKRMALDPTAEDWGDHLEIERSTYHPRGSASPLESDSLDHIADELKSVFEAAAEGHLEFVLSVLDGVRNAVIAAIRHRHGEPEAVTLNEPLPLPSTPQPVVPVPDVSPSPKPPPGRLF